MQQQHMMFIFWDLRRAFDRVFRPAMWDVLAAYGCPPDFVRLVRALCGGIVERVCRWGSLSSPFPIGSGLGRGCVLAPACFSLCTAAVLGGIPPDAPSVGLRFRLDGGVFDLARLRARTGAALCEVLGLQCAGDGAAPGGTTGGLRLLADACTSAYVRFGMRVGTGGTGTLVRGPPGAVLPSVDTKVDERPMEEVDRFSYLRASWRLLPQAGGT